MSAQRMQHCSSELIIIFVLSCLLWGCDRQSESPVKVSLSSGEQHEMSPPQKSSALRIAISAVISPKETFIIYKDLLNYISEKLDVNVELIQRQTYEEVNNLVRDNELDLAFVCSGAYIDGHDQFGMELLVAPVAYGEPVYYSYIIVPESSEAEHLEDLRGKRFAFTDPMSNTGKLAPTYMLARMNENIDSFFSDSIFTYSHDRSIEMVAHSLVDGGAIDGLIWEYMNSHDPNLTSQTRIIRKSEPFGIPPVVVPSSLDKELKEKLRSLLMNIHTDEEGMNILEKLHIDKFVILDDHNYDSIRKMQTWVSDK
ncbi:phosphate/phosphite/phosphonate ABC transporter substrate-binding protein [Thermodesulfobacteriota bacterium]